jgi:hypothetical protein
MTVKHRVANAVNFSVLSVRRLNILCVAICMVFAFSVFYFCLLFPFSIFCLLRSVYCCTFSSFCSVRYTVYNFVFIIYLLVH